MLHFPDRINRLPPYVGSWSARCLSADGCQVLFASYPPGYRIPSRSYNSDNLSIVTQGEMLLTLYGVERCYRAGQWYHVPPGTPHAARVEVATSTIEFRFTPDGG